MKAPKMNASAAEQSRHANTTVRKRIMVLALVFGILTFCILFVKLFQLQIVGHASYLEAAQDGQTRDSVVSANRGQISDAKGDVLAISATVQNVIISPKQISADKLNKNFIANGLAQILEIEPDPILERMEKTNRQYEAIALKVEDDKAQLVRDFIVENDIAGAVYLQPDTKRYYPKSSLAAQVIGFVNNENSGSFGLEVVYNETLAGQRGRIVTQKVNGGREMLGGYEAYVDAQPGNNLTLTIDTTIQGFAQKTLEEGIEKFEAIDGGFCIVMNPKTAAVYAMVSLPDYNLQNPSEVTDPVEAAKIETAKKALETAQARGTATEEEIATLAAAYQNAVNEGRNKQWLNKNLVDTYEPGSTFKPIVMAMAIEEGLINESTSFTCTGSQMVPGWPKPISCSNKSGHGSQNTRKALMNSCNPAMIQISQKLGTQRFYDYLRDFGFMEKTGIDLQGENIGQIWPESEFNSNLVSLATASFGQRFESTPIRLITALSAVINGGNLLEPYVVQSVSDKDGNVLSYHEPKVVRQVVSKETADLVRDMTTSVVQDGGTGKNARVAGYEIGGKTGTSQTLKEGHLITSFVGFAPADDPEIIVLLAYDHPKPAKEGASETAGGYYISGGNMAAPMAGPLIAEILDYIGIHKEGGAAVGDVRVPNLSGKTLKEAQDGLKAAGLAWKVVGSGGTVTEQTPAANVAIPSGSRVVLYLGEPKSDKKVAVPDVTGRSYGSAKKLLEDRGLYMKAPGTDSNTQMVAFSQSILAGTEAATGTVVEVRFMDDNVKDYAN